MEFFKISRDIPFMRHALVLNGISLLTFLAAVFFLFSRGLHLSVEFTGGTLMEVGYSQSADLAAIRSTVDGLGIKDVQVQNFGTARDVMIAAERIITVIPSTPLLEATRAMTERDIHQLPVVEDGRMVGVLSRGDVLARLETRQRLAAGQ